MSGMSGAPREAAQTGARPRPAWPHGLRRQGSHEATMAQHVLTLRCDNRPGIVAAVATRLAANGGNITEAHQFDDQPTGKFFMRVAFDDGGRDRRLRGRVRRGGGALRHGLDAAADGPAAQGDDPGLDVRPLPGRPALSLADRRAADGGGRDRLQPPARRRWPTRDSPTCRSTTCRSPGRPSPAQEAELRRPDRGDRRRAGRARPLHAGAVRRDGGLARRGAASTSTTRSCPASRAPSPITRRTSAG